MVPTSFNHESKNCKRCGASFVCEGNDIAICQCSQVLISQETARFLESTFWGCLCSNCLKEMDEKVGAIKNEIFPNSNELQEGTHFYLDKGQFVFTERYHLLRGSCCKSGCRHCLYGFKKTIL